MAQFFDSKTFVNSILSVCRKNLKLYEKRLHQRSYSSSQIHKSTSRYHNKVVFRQLWKCFCLWDKFGIYRGSNPELFFKKRCCQRFWKISKKLPLLESLFWKITLKGRNKRNPSRIAFLWILPNFFRTLLVRVTSGWLLLRPLSRITHQNFVRFQGKHLRESSVTVKRLALRFAPVLLINLKLMISWY